MAKKKSPARKARKKRRARSDSNRKGRLVENIFAAMHDELGDGVKVEKRVRVPGGEIDVLLTSCVAGYSVRIPIECKNEEGPAKEGEINKFWGKLQGSGIPSELGIFVSARGYTKPARERAAHFGIRLLELKGLAQDRLAPEVRKALRSTIHLLAVVRGVMVTSSVPKYNELGDMMVFFDRDGFMCGNLPDLIWREWMSGSIKNNIGPTMIKLKIPEDWCHVVEGKKHKVMSVVVRLQVLGLVVTGEGEAERLTLVDAATGQVEKTQFNLRFDPTRVEKQVTVLDSEAGLKEVTKGHDVIARTRLPRIEMGPLYWPPTIEAAEKVARAVREFEAKGAPKPYPVKIEQIEGTQLETILAQHAMWPRSPEQLGLIKRGRLAYRDATSARTEGRLYEAKLTYAQSQKRFEEAGDRRSAGVSAFAIAEIERVEGHRVEAVAAYKAADTHFRAVGDVEKRGAALFWLGTLALELERHQEGEKTLRDALKIWRSFRNESRMLDCVIHLGIALECQRRRAEAERRFDEALAIARRLGETDREAMALANLGNQQRRSGDLARARVLLGEALGATRRVDGDEQALRLLLDLGSLEREDSKLDVAEKYYKEAARVARDRGDGPREAQALNALAELSLDDGRLDEARAAATLATKKLDASVYERCLAQTTLGRLHLASGSLSDAAIAFEEAAKIARESTDPVAEALALSNLATLRSMQGEFKEAVRLYEEALPMHRQIGDERNEALALFNLGIALARQGRDGDALARYAQAERLYRKTGDPAGEGRAIANRALVAFEQGRTSKSLALYEGAIQRLRPLATASVALASVLGNHGLLLQELGRYSEARRSYEEALALDRAADEERAAGIVLTNLARLDADAGALEDAARRADEAVTSFRAAGEVRWEAIANVVQANIQALRGDIGAAQELCLDAITRLTGEGDEQQRAVAQVDIARIERWAGLLDTAEQRLGAAAAPLRRGTFDFGRWLIERAHLAMAREEDPRSHLRDLTALVRRVGARPESQLGTGLEALRRARKAQRAGRPLVRGQLVEDYPAGVRAQVAKDCLS